MAPLNVDFKRAQDTKSKRLNERRSIWEAIMRRPAALFPIALALGAIILAPRGGAQAQDAREEGPREIEKCKTISKPGSYRLVNDLTFTGTTGTCLTIAASSVTIDLAGFTISGPNQPFPPNLTTAIGAGNDTTGIAVRNGSIAGFSVGVDLGGDGSIVEGLRVFGHGCPCLLGIGATGVVKGNTVVGIAGLPGPQGTGISATGIVTGNYVIGSRAAEYEIGEGSTVIGNTAGRPFAPPGIGFLVSCPSNVTDNTTVSGLVLNGTGCNNTNNVGG
jgi:hypothetical protein